MDPRREAKSNHPASRSAIAAAGFRLKPFSIFLDNSSTDLGSLHDIQHVMAEIHLSNH